jgi:sec-independent protein translocase protein TatB
MIDLGLSKLALIGVVALVVIGPEKLPTVARMAGSLFGRAQRYLNDVKAEVSREIELDELRKMQQEVHETATSLGQSIAQGIADAKSDVQSAWKDSDDEPFDSSRSSQSVAQMTDKARDFRRKRLARTSAIPHWYKQQSGRRTRVISAAARVAKYRPSTGKTRRFFW